VEKNGDTSVTHYSGAGRRTNTLRKHRKRGKGRTRTEWLRKLRTESGNEVKEKWKEEDNNSNERGGGTRKVKGRRGTRPGLPERGERVQMKEEFGTKRLKQRRYVALVPKSVGVKKVIPKKVGEKAAKNY